MTRNLARRRALRALGRRLGCKALTPDAVDLFDVALTHDSYSYEHARGDAAISNERLEFLGDAVLGHVAAHALYERYPAEPEGSLSRKRAALVSRQALAATARRLDVGALLRLGKGEAAAGGERRPSILAAVFEALVGAVYLSNGFAAAAGVVAREHLAHAAEPATVDPKTALQEYAQARFKHPPTYAVTSEAGPAHAKQYTVAVSIGANVLGTGTGPTKKQAQVEAAEHALKRLATPDQRRRGSDQST